MTRIVTVLLLASVFAAACVQDSNPPNPPGGGGGGGGDAADAGDDGGTGGGVGGGTGGGAGGGGGGGGAAPSNCVDDAGTMATYTAPIQPTGAIRFFIQREVPAGAIRCVQMSFMYAQGPTDGGLSVPPNWTYERTRMRDRACASGGNGGYTDADDAQGAVFFSGRSGAGNPTPTSVAVHAMIFSTVGDVCMSADGVSVQ